MRDMCSMTSKYSMDDMYLMIKMYSMKDMHIVRFVSHNDCKFLGLNSHVGSYLKQNLETNNKFSISFEGFLGLM